jgi:HK97 family phage portal protein
MNLKQRIQLAYKSLTTPSLGNSFGSVMRNYGKQSSFQPEQQLQGITYKAIDKIGQAVSVYEPQVQKANLETYVQHPLINLFNQPNPRQTGTDFIYLYAMFYSIYGETFWYKARGENSNKIKELYLLNPAQIQLQMNDGELVGYILHKMNGTQIPFTLDEIFHDKRPNPFNEWRGMSVMERASVYIDTEITTSVFTLNYMRNNASPSGIVSLPNMDKETFKQFAAQWREGYEGPENAGKTAFIRGGEADFKAVGATLKDVDQKITRQMAKEDVLMMLEVPKEILGMSSDAGFGRNTVEAFSYIFSKETIEPIMRRLDRIYETFLNEFGRNDLAKNITHVSPIPEDKVHQLERQTKGTNVWLTVNEARAIDGLPPLEDGTGDTIQPKNVVQPVAPAKSAESEVQKIVLKKSLTKADKQKNLKQEQEAFRKNLVETNDVYAVKIKSTLSKFTAKQGDKIIANINASGKAYEEWLPSVKEDSVELAALLTPIMIDLIEAQSEDVANFITGELLTISPEVRRDVEANVLKISGGYNEDTIKAIQKTLGQGQTQGESLVKLKKRVEQVISDAKGYRAERIARTESLRASNSTAEMVYSQNGFSHVEWFVNPGACEFCLTYAGTSKAIGSNFTNIGDVINGKDGGTMSIEYSDIETPPLHPNCTCSLVPVN